VRASREGWRRVVQAVVWAREVPVVVADDRMHTAFDRVGSLPLADARPAGGGKHGPTHLLEGLQEAGALHRVVDPLRARRDEEGGLGLEAGLQALTGDMRRAADILVGGVRAAPDQRRLELHRIALLPGLGRHLRDWTREVRRVWPDHVGF